MKKDIEYFRLEDIADSGQCFRMEGTEDKGYTVIAFGRLLNVKQDGSRVEFDCTEEEYREIWETYFDLKRDYRKVRERIDQSDRYLARAAQFGEGIRILKQELWEMILTFLISQQNNIKRIKKCINGLCERYGEQRTAENGIVYHTFPGPEDLKDASEEALRGMNLGYRSKYIEKTVRSILEGEVSLTRIAALPYKEAREELKRLSGVGDKVADCICLFGLGHLEAFPVDTHIKGVLQREYPEGFPFEKYRDIAGILQQYLFYYDLLGGSGTREV